jgi:hypothetical protein
MQEVSRIRFDRTLCAEYPNLREYMTRLKGERAEQSPETLAKLWQVTMPEAVKIADSLNEIGFFERRGSGGQPLFFVANLYHRALDIKDPR